MVPRPTVRRPKEKPLVSASLLTAYPSFQSARVFHSILSAQVARGGIYVPEYVELGKLDNYQKMPFEPELCGLLEKRWEEAPRPGLSLERYHPHRIYTNMFSKQDWLPFSFLAIHVQRDFFTAQARFAEFLDLLKVFYDNLHPAYGYVGLHEMAKKYDHPLGRISPGLDLEKALPNIEWAVFLGPEYVEMFGQQKVLTAPANRAELLSDGGALLTYHFHRSIT